jgi:hypothetical protein
MRDRRGARSCEIAGARVRVRSPGHKFPGYMAAPRQRGLSPHTRASPFQRAPLCSRGIHSPAGSHGDRRACSCEIAGARVRVRSPGHKFPGYMAAPRQRGLSPHTRASPFQRAPPCSRGIHSPAGSHGDRRACSCEIAGARVHTRSPGRVFVRDRRGACSCEIAEARVRVRSPGRVFVRDRRAINSPGYTAAPRQRGLSPRPRVSPFQRAPPCSRGTSCPGGIAWRQTRVLMRDRRGACSYEIARARVRARSPGRVFMRDRRGACSREIAGARVRARSPGHKFPGYKAAPRQRGLSPHTRASPFQRAPPCSRGTSCPGGIAWRQTRVFMRDRRGACSCEIAGA